ncbi:hypothetical protein [Streptomyces sp. H27-H5]|uniref:hypothetical protein n=1 Tax=Streptomyces sp. H27-H5 TaxID=2996460 RepID=UPI0022715BCA|nr:hypothetical protein [Streptomyces sp. H27-H5]MCY0957724.1 hypothetical protein [Streptomyces sp. H27-H5]
MPASKAVQAATSERRRKAVSMRLAGVDWQTITEQLGYRDRNTACKDVRRALAAARKAEAEEVEALKAMTVLRYDRLQAAFWSKALKGDAKAAEVVIKIIAGRSRIEGTEAPVRMNVDAQRLGDEIMALIHSEAGDAEGAPDDDGRGH